MSNRVKYPLTEAAKQAAIRLVEEWTKGNLPQLFGVADADPGTMMEGRDRKDQINNILPNKAIFFELAQFRLVSIRHIPKRLPEERPHYIDSWGYHEWWEILLLEELRNAVQNDFAVSDFFLTTSTVGSIINLGEGASLSGIQSIAINYGTAIQNVEQLADKLTDVLGESLLKSNAEIRAAIDALRTADQSNTTNRIGKVIEALGRDMGHVANAATILAMLAQYLPHVVR